MMKKIISIILIFSFTISISSCQKEETMIKKHYSSTYVQDGTISNDKSYIGYIESENTIPLATKVGGRIENINVKEGDRILAGQLLVNLDASEAKTGYSSVSNIIGALDKMKSNTSLLFDSQAIGVEAKIGQVKSGQAGLDVGLSDTRNITENQLKTAQSGVNQASLGLETAKTNLEQTKKVLETKKDQIYKNTKSAITNSVILDTNVLNFIDNLIGVTESNKDKNDNFDEYLSVKNSAYLNQTRQDFLDTNNLFTIYKKNYKEKIENKNPDNETIKQITLEGIKLAEKLKILLDDTYNVLENSVENVYFPLSIIANYKNQVSTMGQNIEASLVTVSGEYILGLKGSIDNMNSFSSQSEMQISLLEKQVSLAEAGLKTANATYEQYKSMSEGQINDLIIKQNIASGQLQEANSGLSSLEKQKQASISEIEAKIAEAKAQQNNSAVMIENAQIISPINGVVIKKLSDIGQVVGGGMPILMIADEINLKIKVPISDDMKKDVMIGDKVKIEIPGYDKQIETNISNILPDLDPITKKSVVEISILNTDKKIKIGSYSKVYFLDKNQKEKQKGKIIANNAIVSDMLNPGVYKILEDIKKDKKTGKIIKTKKAIFVSIKIIKQNDNFSLIEGLELSDRIITDGKENIYDGEILE